MKKIKGILLISSIALSIFLYGCGASNAVKGGVIGGVAGGVVEELLAIN